MYFFLASVLFCIENAKFCPIVKGLLGWRYGYQWEVSTIILRMLESFGFQKYITCRWVCHCICLCICVISIIFEVMTDKQSDILQFQGSPPRPALWWGWGVPASGSPPHRFRPLPRHATPRPVKKTSPSIPEAPHAIISTSFATHNYFDWPFLLGYKIVLGAIRCWLCVSSWYKEHLYTIQCFFCRT